MSEVLEDRVARLEHEVELLRKHLTLEGRLVPLEDRVLRLEVRREVAADVARLDAKIDALRDEVAGLRDEIRRSGRSVQATPKRSRTDNEASSQ